MIRLCLCLAALLLLAGICPACDLVGYSLTAAPPVAAAPAPACDTCAPAAASLTYAAPAATFSYQSAVIRQRAIYAPAASFAVRAPVYGYGSAALAVRSPGVFVRAPGVAVRVGVRSSFAVAAPGLEVLRTRGPLGRPLLFPRRTGVFIAP